MRASIRSKLPEIMIEAAMVVVAVLAALAVEEWREHRQQLELADRAVAVVMAEIESNRRDVVENLPANEALLQRVVAADRSGVMPDDFDLTFEYALLAESGWQAAQVTEAIHFIPLDQVERIARLYGLQALYQRSQDRVLEFILDVGPLARSDPDQIPGMVRGALTTAVGMQAALAEAYDSVLVEMNAAAR